MKTISGKLKLGKAVSAAVMATAFFLSVSIAAPQARAFDDRADCQHAVEKAEGRLDQAVQRKGPDSREANDRRRDLNAEREKCWGKFHQWWNGKDHRWETEHNWDQDHR